MKTRIFYISFILIFIQIQLKAQFIKNDLNNNFKKEKLNPGLAKEVFSPKNLIIIGASIGTAFLLDEIVKKNIQRNKNKTFDIYTDIMNEFGEKKFVLPATLATWAIATACKNKTLSTTALNSTKAVITAAILTESIKYISGRSRPYLNKGNMQFKAFGGTVNSVKSLPSGHAFLSWAVFTPFAQEYSKWIYIIPASVSLSRIYRNKHWLSDVALGGAIGYLAGLYFHKRKNQKILLSGNGIIIKF